MKLATLAAIVAVAALPAAAQTNTPRVDQREANQDARIQQGVQSGRLTTSEATHLENGQARVQALQTKDKADGKVTAKERAQLTRVQNRQSRKIYRKKHNARNTTPAS